MNGDLTALLKKLSLPVLFLVLGIAMTVFAITDEQGTLFLLASLLMLLAGVISIVYSLGKLNTKALIIIGIFAGIAGFSTLFISTKSVYDTTVYNENYKKAKSLAIQNLKDIRYIQKAYAEKEGKYLDSWDAFNEYAKNGKVLQVVKKGTVPDETITAEERDYLYHDKRAIDNKMTEEEAYRLSKWPEGPRYNQLFKNFSIDTIEISFMKAKFGTRSYKESRDKAGFSAFNYDSLQYIPFTGARTPWSIEVKDSVMVNEEWVPAIRVEGQIPFSKVQGEEDELIWFGKLSGDLGGSWEDE